MKSIGTSGGSADPELPETGDALLQFKQLNAVPSTFQARNSAAILDDPLTRLSELDDFAEPDEGHAQQPDEHEAAATRAAAIATLEHQRCSKLQPDEAALAPWLEAMATILDGHPKDADEPELPVQIAPGVLLGDKFCAWDASKLMETHGVTHVLNCADTSAKGPIDHESLGLRYMQLDADDDVTYDMIGRHLAEASAFIRSAREESGVCLLHCHAGVNRSGALAIAHLLMDGGLSLVDAVEFCVAARGTVLTNQGFRLQLLRLAHREGRLSGETARAQSAGGAPKAAEGRANAGNSAGASAAASDSAAAVGDATKLLTTRSSPRDYLKMLEESIAIEAATAGMDTQRNPPPKPAGDEQCMVGLPPTPDELSHLIWDPRVSPDGQFNEIEQIDAGLSPPQGQRGVSSKADGRAPSGAEAMLIGLPPTAEQLQDHPHIDQDGFLREKQQQAGHLGSRLFGSRMRS